MSEPLINKLENFSLSWEFSKDNGVTWTSAGTSISKVYVALAGATGLETVADIACRNAMWVTAQQPAFEGIWADFTDWNVPRVNEAVPMFYYGQGGDTPADATTKEKLVATRDGRCGAWQQLFFATLNLHDINATSVTIKPHIVEKLINPQNPPPIPIPGGYWRYIPTEILIKAEMPTQGRGHENQIPPAPINFADHAVVGYMGGLFDPSYGQSYTGSAPQLDWEAASLSCVRYTEEYTGQDFFWFREDYIVQYQRNIPPANTPLMCDFS